MKSPVLLAWATALLFTAEPLMAQTPDGSANRTAMERLNFMVGRWQGEAWMQRGPEKVQTTMTEVVEAKLGGTVLHVQGQGVVPGSGGTAPRIVHDALGVISFDPQAGTYAMRSYIGTGQLGDFALTLTPGGGVSWSREVPGGRVRNTAQFANGEWREVSEFSRDGVTWMQVMEIKLRRAP